MAKKTLTDIKLQGDKQLIKTLKQLPLNIRKRSIKKAVSAAGQVVLKAARKNAPVRHGFLHTSLIKTTKKYQNDNYVAVVGPKFWQITGPNGEGINPAFYAHLTEGGTKRGVAPRHWMKKAYEETKAKTKEIMAKQFAKDIKKFRAKGK